jgi:hypothetical protein
MNLDMMMKQVDDIAQFLLDLDVVRPDYPEGDEVDDRGKLVLDAMIELVQEGSSLQGWRMGSGMDHSELLIDINYTV